MAVAGSVHREDLECRDLGALHLDRVVLAGRRRCDVVATTIRGKLQVLRIRRTVVQERVDELIAVVAEYENAVVGEGRWTVVADEQIRVVGLEDREPAG